MSHMTAGEFTPDIRPPLSGTVANSVLQSPVIAELVVGALFAVLPRLLERTHHGRRCRGRTGHLRVAIAVALLPPVAKFVSHRSPGRGERDDQHQHRFLESHGETPFFP